MRPSLDLPTMADDLSNMHLSKDEFREYGYQLVDWLAEYFDNVDQYQVLPSIEPGDIRNMLPVSAPERAEPMEEIIADLDRVVMPGVAHWQHPGWYAFFPSGGSPVSALGEFVVCLIPVSSSLNLKAVARAAGVKRASMADGKVAERRTGYVLGGISPFGQNRRHRTFVEELALSLSSIYVSAGKRGLEIRVVPQVFSALLDASFVRLTNYG